MRKYVVPIVALAGIALLSPSANAVDLIIKSRAIPPGGAGSLPVIVRNAPATGLWGIDAGLTFNNAALTAAATAFTPNAKGTSAYDATKDVAISGTTFVGTGAQPNVYFGYVRGATGIAAPTTTVAAVGLLKLSVTAGTARGGVVNLAATDYNVKNTGTDAGSTRPGATAATVNASNAVVAEPVTVLDLYPAGTAPGAGAPDLRVPAHKVAIGAPGDLNADGNVAGSADLANVAAVLVGKAAASWTEYKRIASDVAPPNGYTPTDISGTAGLGYGDGQVGSADLGFIAAKSINKPSAANFPVPE